MPHDVDATEGQGWLGRFAGEISPIGLPLNNTTLALANSLVVKSGAGTLFGFSGYDTASEFVLVFDANSVPAEGAVPKIVVSVAATRNFYGHWGTVGRAFHHGIVICNSSTGPTKTIGGATMWCDCQYV